MHSCCNMLSAWLKPTAGLSEKPLRVGIGVVPGSARTVCATRRVRVGGLRNLAADFSPTALGLPLATIALLLLSTRALAQQPAGAPTYAHDIRPILVSRC